MKAIITLLSFLLLLTGGSVAYLYETGICKVPNLILGLSITSICISLVILFVSFVTTLQEDL